MTERTYDPVIGCLGIGIGEDAQRIADGANLVCLLNKWTITGEWPLGFQNVMYQYTTRIVHMRNSDLTDYSSCIMEIPREWDALDV